MLCASPDLLEQRRLPGRDVERRPAAIHLYGVDLMSTAECLGYFGEWGPTFCEWINDSSCTLLTCIIPQALHLEWHTPSVPPPLSSHFTLLHLLPHVQNEDTNNHCLAMLRHLKGCSW